MIYIFYAPPSTDLLPFPQKLPKQTKTNHNISHNGHYNLNMIQGTCVFFLICICLIFLPTCFCVQHPRIKSTHAIGYDAYLLLGVVCLKKKISGLNKKILIKTKIYTHTHTHTRHLSISKPCKYISFLYWGSGSNRSFKQAQKRCVIVEKFQGCVSLVVSVQRTGGGTAWRLSTGTQTHPALYTKTLGKVYRSLTTLTVSLDNSVAAAGESKCAHNWMLHVSLVVHTIFVSRYY